jgi:hypothetical protein
MTSLSWGKRRFGSSKTTAARTGDATLFFCANGKSVFVTHQDSLDDDPRFIAGIFLPGIET